MRTHPLQETIQYIALSNLAIERIANAMLKKFHLTASSFKLLNFIAEDNNPLTPSQLQKFLETSLASISQRLNQLEKYGYIERISAGPDRRQVGIAITKKGKEIYESAWKESKKIEDYMQGKFDDTTSAQFLGVLKEYYKTLSLFEKSIKSK